MTGRGGCRMVLPLVRSHANKVAQRATGGLRGWLRASTLAGEMAEWFKAHAWKA